MHNLTKSKMVNRLLALLMQLKVKVTSKGQDQLVSKGKVTKKAVCLSNSIQHLVTGCSNNGLCYQMISPYWVQGDAAKAS